MDPAAWNPDFKSTREMIKVKSAKNLYTYCHSRIPMYSRLHPMIPKLYVPEWKLDMKNRELIVKNATSGLIPNFEHDENLFLEKREQLAYNVESRAQVDQKYEFPPRAVLLRPPLHHETSHYQSELMMRRDDQL